MKKIVRIISAICLVLSTAFLVWLVAVTGPWEWLEPCHLGEGCLDFMTPVLPYYYATFIVILMALWIFKMTSKKDAGRNRNRYSGKA